MRAPSAFVTDDGTPRGGRIVKYLEDFAIGERMELGSHLFTAQAIKAFASRFDPQRFHLDEAEAERSHFGRLCASGWHTTSVWMRMFVDYRKREIEARKHRGEPVARTGRSPEFRELKWLKPVYVGDTISYFAEIAEQRPSQSRPGWGINTMRASGVNQHGETVFSFLTSGFVERRPGTADT